MEKDIQTFLDNWISKLNVKGFVPQGTGLLTNILEAVVEFIEAYEQTDWYHNLPGGEEETIRAYLIPLAAVEKTKRDSTVQQRYFLRNNYDMDY